MWPRLLPAEISNSPAAPAFDYLVRSARECRRLLTVSYARRLAIAAVSFTVGTAIEYGHPVKILRELEKDLLKRLGGDA